LVGGAGELAAEAAARALELAARVTVWKVPGALRDVCANLVAGGQCGASDTQYERIGRDGLLCRSEGESSGTVAAARSCHAS
jgi:hypothetical protein